MSHIETRSDSPNWRKTVSSAKIVSTNTTTLVPTTTPAPTAKTTMREKQSVGLACCRRDKVTNRVQILLVCKRYTYAYCIFVHGQYNSGDNAAIQKLFCGMTVDEKFDILSLNFTQIWYRIWLNNAAKKSFYFRAKTKFENTFAADSGVRLHKLIAHSTHSERIWEVPKGRKNGKNEQDIHCAIREFYEETCIPKSNYKVFMDASRTETYIDDNVKYTHKYFIAFTRHNVDPRINFNMRDQIEEVSDIKWMDIEEVRRVDHTGRLIPLVTPIFNYIKKNS